jgi:predicted transcriptional regulator
MSKQPTEKHPCTFRLSKDCQEKLKQLALYQNTSKTAIIENLVKKENL